MGEFGCECEWVYGCAVYGCMGDWVTVTVYGCTVYGCTVFGCMVVYLYGCKVYGARCQSVTCRCRNAGMVSGHAPLVGMMGRLANSALIGHPGVFAMPTAQVSPVGFGV